MPMAMLRRRKAQARINRWRSLLPSDARKQFIVDNKDSISFNCAYTRQIELDVNRSISFCQRKFDNFLIFHLLDSLGSFGNKRFRTQLLQCIVEVFARHPEWQYFQGVHDLGAVICSVFYKRPVHESSAMLEYLLAGFMLPFLTQPLDEAFKPCFEHVISMLFLADEPKLANFLGSTGGMWMLSWILTWFSHCCLDDNANSEQNAIFTLFECVFQTNDAYFIDKVAVSLLLHNKKRILEAFSAGNEYSLDEGELFAMLQNLPKSSNFHQCIESAYEISDEKKQKITLYLSFTHSAISICIFLRVLFYFRHWFWELIAQLHF